MAYSYEELKKKKVAELREIAEEMDHADLKGAKQLNKEHLLEALCKVLGLEMHVHHEVVGVNKSEIKTEIKALKKKRDEAIKTKNQDELRRVRRQIRTLKKTLRKATV